MSIQPTDRPTDRPAEPILLLPGEPAEEEEGVYQQEPDGSESQRARLIAQHNRWVRTVVLTIDWDCVCGQHHRVTSGDADVLVCAGCNRIWHIGHSGIRIHYDDPPRRPAHQQLVPDGQMSLFADGGAGAVEQADD